MNGSVLKWLRKQKMMVSFKATMDRLYLLNELVEQGEFKSRSKAIEEAIDLLLRQYYPELDENKRLGDFVRADLLVGGEE
ncbi:ribbon-helix-helix domain-containing protein [Archaeoglobus sp.]